MDKAIEAILTGLHTHYPQCQPGDLLSACGYLATKTMRDYAPQGKYRELVEEFVDRIYTSATL